MKSKIAVTGCVVAVVLAAGLLPPTDAAAKLVAITYSGTAHLQFNFGGLFGGLPVDQTADFTDTFVFDLNRGSRVSFSGFDVLFGGSFSGSASPLIDSRLTINGQTVDFPGGASDHVIYTTTMAQAGSTEYNSGPYGYENNIVSINASTPAVLSTPFSAVGTPGYSLFSICYTPGCDATEFTTSVVVLGYLSATQITARIVPEPETWVMMLVGLCGLGALLRARRDRGPFERRGMA